MKLTSLAACSFLFAAGLTAQAPAPGSTGVFFRPVGIGAASVKNAPFSADAITETTITLGDGNRIVQRNTQKLYRDNDGRERREQYAPTTGGLDSVAISDPVAGSAFTLHPERGNALRTARVAIPPYGLTNNLALVAGGPFLPAQPAKEDLGTKNFEGVNAQGTRTTYTIRAGEVGNQLPIKIIEEDWYSPELQMNVMTTHNDPRSGDIVYRLTNIVRADPPRSLFEVPPGYTIQGAAQR